MTTGFVQFVKMSFLPKRKVRRLMLALLVFMVCMSSLMLFRRKNSIALFFSNSEYVRNNTRELLFPNADPKPKASVVPVNQVIPRNLTNDVINNDAVHNVDPKPGDPVAHVTPIVPRNLSNTGYQVTVAVTGFLGNRMFQYASLLGIARMNGMRPFYGSQSNLGSIFQVTHVEDQRNQDFKKVFEESFASYDPKFERLPRGADVLCMQYFQSWRYFDFIGDEIRRELTFKQHVQDSAAGLLRVHAGAINGKVKVGVHVRRGDFLISVHVRKGYHTAPGSYIRQAMARMREKHGSGVVFVVVTQDEFWFREEVRNASDYVIVGEALAEVHLAVLASCDHVIMTVGTYGWWGGYLAGGDVVYWWNANETLHNPPLEAEVRKPEDLYPPSWIRLTG